MCPVPTSSELVQLHAQAPTEFVHKAAAVDGRPQGLAVSVRDGWQLTVNVSEDDESCASEFEAGQGRPQSQRHHGRLIYQNKVLLGFRIGVQVMEDRLTINVGCLDVRECQDVYGPARSLCLILDFVQNTMVFGRLACLPSTCDVALEAVLSYTLCVLLLKGVVGTSAESWLFVHDGPHPVVKEAWGFHART